MSWLGAALAAACGGSDTTVVQRPGPGQAETASGTHVTLRSGHDVSGYCLASKGLLTAFAVIERSGVRLYTSVDPALEEPRFKSGPPLTAVDASARCQLAATAEGFAIAWVGATPEGPGVLVQRLSDDGTPLADPLPVGPTSRDRFAFAERDQRLYVGRVADAESGPPEIWIDSIDSDQVASELVASCGLPSLPVLLPNETAVDAFYVCSSEETAELIVSQVVDGERRSVSVATEAVGFAEPALAAVDLDERWAVVFATSALEEFPPLLEIDKDSLEIAEHGLGEARSSVPWEVSLFERGGNLLMRADVCQTPTETGEIACGVELCTLEFGAESASACGWLDIDNSAELLPRETGTILAFLELAQDAGRDLFSVPVDEELAIATTPSPVLGPGRLDPQRVSCDGAACTVFGHEGASRLETASLLERSSALRHGFWTIWDVADPDEIEEAVVLDVSYPVVTSDISSLDWSVAAVWWAEGTPQFGVLDSGGVRARQSDFGYRDPLGLFHERSDGISRYRLFSLDTTLEQGSGLYLSTFDETAVEPAVRVASERIDPIGRCGTRYVGIDSERRLHRFDPEFDSEFVPGAELPELAAADGELVRCLGEQVVGVSYSATETRVYREEANGQFREWQFNDAGNSLPDGGGEFRATAGQLDDGRIAFILQPGGGFGVPLIALLLGGSGEPEPVALELPEGAALAAAATPQHQSSERIVLAWSQAATRATTLSTFLLP